MVNWCCLLSWILCSQLCYQYFSCTWNRYKLLFLCPECSKRWRSSHQYHTLYVMATMLQWLMDVYVRVELWLWLKYRTPRECELDKLRCRSANQLMYGHWSAINHFSQSLIRYFLFPDNLPPIPIHNIALNWNSHNGSIITAVLKPTSARAVTEHNTAPAPNKSNRFSVYTHWLLLVVA